MRKIILFIACSLDGYIAGEGDGIGWLFTDADYGYSAFYNSIDAVLVGKRTYDQAKGFDEYPFKGKKCYVFTRDKSMKKDDNAEFIGEPVAFAKKLLKLSGKNIWLVGGGEIISLFLNNSLIDEIILSIHPIILGSGIPLFRDINC